MMMMMFAPNSPIRQKEKGGGGRGEWQDRQELILQILLPRQSV